MADLSEEIVLETLKQIIDPDLGKDIVTGKIIMHTVGIPVAVLPGIK